MDTNKLQRIICAGLLGSALALNGVASAAVVTNRVPLLGYADHNITVYRAPGGMQAAVVAAEAALIQITQVRADGWAYGTYPMSNGRRAGGWFRMSDMQGNVSFNNVTGKILYQQTVYRTPSMSGGNGILTQGASVLVIAEQGGLSQVIYKQPNSVNWRIGWVMSDSVEKTQVAATNQVNQNKTVNQVTTAASDSANKALQAAQNTTAGASSQTKIKQQTNTGTVAKAANTQLQNITVSNERNTGLVLGNASETEVAKRYVKVYPNASLSTPYKGRFIDKGESYSVIGQSGNALHVKYKSGKGEDREGWVPSSIREGETPPARIILSTEIAKRYVYVYPDASLSTPYQGRFIDKGESYSVIEQSVNALYVKYKSGKGEDREGWVPSSIREREVTPIPNIINNNTNPIVVPVQRQVVTNGIKGDLNQDGKVDQTDLDILGKIIIGKIPATDLYKAVGDMDGDGIIDIMDASQIMFLIKDDPTPVTEIAKRHVNVYPDASLSTPYQGRFIDKGESYSVIMQSGNALEVKYKSGKGEDRRGWVPSSIREEIQIDYGDFPPQTKVETCRGKEVIVDTFNGVPAIYPAKTGNYNGSAYSKTYNCAAYVKKYYIAIYGFEPNNLVPNSTPKNSRTGKYFTKITDGSVKAGDVIGMSSSFASVNGHWGIAKGVDGAQIVLIEQNKRASNSITAPVNRRVPISGVNVYRWIE